MSDEVSISGHELAVVLRNTCKKLGVQQYIICKHMESASNEDLRAETIKKYLSRREGFPTQYCTGHFAWFMKVFHGAVKLCIEDETLDSDTIRRNWELYGKDIDESFFAVHREAITHSSK